MAIRFFAAAVASLGLMEGAFAQCPTPCATPCSTPVASCNTCCPQTASARAGRFQRRSAAACNTCAAPVQTCATPVRTCATPCPTPCTQAACNTCSPCGTTVVAGRGLRARNTMVVMSSPTPCMTAGTMPMTGVAMMGTPMAMPGVVSQPMPTTKTDPLVKQAGATEPAKPVTGTVQTAPVVAATPCPCPTTMTGNTVMPTRNRLIGGRLLGRWAY